MLERTLLVALVVACPVVARAAALKPAGADTFFVSPGESAVLRWRLADGKPPEGLDYTIRDYWGKAAGAGRATVSPAGAVQATVQLARGYYDVAFAATKQRFGVVSLPPVSGEADPFFCIDSAMSWLVGDDAVREGLIKALRRSGIVMSRERLNWGQIDPAAGTWNWQCGQRYETVRRLHARHGVAVLEMFHHATPWHGLVGKYPDDLVRTARSWEQIARRWRATWGALEVWNEPDIFFGGHLPGDQYAALVKALSYAVGRGKAAAPVVGGVVAHHNRRFLDTAALNGMLDCVDVASFHTYGRAIQMMPLVEKYRDWLKAHERGSMPLWITECGRPWRKGPPRPPTDQDADSALDITMKAVEARACGVARYFAFVYPYYEEGTNNFGMMGRRATPLRSMAAYAQAAAALAGKRYVGDLHCEDAAIRRARVFAGGKETVAVLYTARAGGKRAVRLDLPAKRVEGIDGRALRAGEGGTVPVPDGLAYVWLDGRRLGKRLRTDTPAMRLTKLAQAAPPRRPPPAPVVLRYQFDPKVAKPNSNEYRFAGDVPARMALRVRAFNLSKRAHELTLELAFARKPARAVGRASRSVKLPAEAFRDVTWQVDLGEAFARDEHLHATVTARGETAGRVLPLTIDLAGRATLKQLLRWHRDPVRLPVAEAARWEANIAGGGKMTFARTAEGHWRLTAAFGKGDPWAYPFFRLPEKVSLSGAKALILRVRCHKPGEVRVFLWEGEGNVGYLTPHAIAPADGKWHTAVVRFDELVPSSANDPDPNGRLDLAGVRRISIGLNSKARDNTLEVSDLYAVGGR